MDKLKTENFTWTSESWKDSGSKTRARTHYNSFQKGTLNVTVGDCVLISNDDSLNPESTEFCLVAKTLDFYEKDDPVSPYRCKVQWYSRIHDIPRDFQLQIMDPDYVQELIVDCRNIWNSEVDAETVFSVCDVIILAENIPGSQITPDYIDGKLLFYCRYAFDGKRLLPAFQLKHPTLRRCSSLLANSQRRTPQNKKMAPRVSSVKSPVTESSDDTVNTSIKNNQIQETSINLHENNEVKNKEDFVEKNEVVSSPENSVPAVMFDTPSKREIQPTPVKSFYSSEKKNVSFRDIDASQVCRALPFGGSKPESKKDPTRSKKILASTSEKTGNKNARLLKESKTCAPMPRRSSKRMSSTITNNELNSVPRRSSKIISSTTTNNELTSVPRRSSKRMSSTATNNELNSLLDMKSCITRSGRKVSWPDYSLYWDGDPLVSSVLKGNKTRKQTSEISTGSDEENDSCIGRKTPNSKIPKRRDVSSSSEEYSSESDEYESMERNRRKNPKMKRKGLRSTTEEYSSETDEYESTKRNRRKTPKMVKNSSKVTTPSRKKLPRTPVSLVRPRKAQHEAPKTPLEEARANLHVSAVPESLPCREEEYSDIFNFVEGKLLEKRGGCMYISGVPGTGKTATVHEVIRSLEESRDLGHLPPFKFVEINALRLTNPHQCFVHFLKALKGIDATSDHALDLLSSYFEEGKNKQLTILMLDELDMLWTKRQDVLYNMFQWPLLPRSHLVVLAIANTMDLPERLLANRVASRLGLTRMTFQPYTFKQLQEIIMSRIQGLNAFNPDAVQLVARKVASVSGDARRALDICRRATELVNSDSKVPVKKNTHHLVDMKHVDTAIQEMFCSSKISAIRNLSLQEQLFLRSIVADFLSSGVEETVFHAAAKQYTSLCHLEGVPVLNHSKLLAICSQLYDMRLLLLENGRTDIYQRIKLNISIDDINYALKDK